MAFSVTRHSRGLVRPSKETPSCVLDLSVIDRSPVLRCNVRTLHVFKHGPGAAQVLKEALSKALVPYHPLAGRLKESTQGQLQIDCSGEGVWLVEACAGDCTLDAVNYFDDYEVIPFDQLFPDQIPETMAGREPLVQMQVTQFACSGFVIGLIFCHSICDGLGAAQFLNAVGEMARGLSDHLSFSPVWNRDFFPPQPEETKVRPFPNVPPPMSNYQLQHASIDIGFNKINQLKKEYQESSGTQNTCSSFEAIAATFWSIRTRAINLKEDTQVTLLFFANCRHLVDPPLPKGFYGNCFFPVTISASSEWLSVAPIKEVVKLIQEAKTRLPIEFTEHLQGGHVKEDGKEPFAPPLGYTTLFMSEWGRLGFNNVDYGWGPPAHIVPIQGSSIIPVGIIGSVPSVSPKKGIRLSTWCVGKVHLQPFYDQMKKLEMDLLSN